MENFHPLLHMRQSDVILIVKMIDRRNPLSRNPVRFPSARISNCVEGERGGFMSMDGKKSKIERTGIACPLMPSKRKQYGGCRNFME